MSRKNINDFEQSIEFNLTHKLYDLMLIVLLSMVVFFVYSPNKATAFLQAVYPIVLDLLQKAIFYNNGIIPIVIGCIMLFKNRRKLPLFLGLYHINTS